jgi:hypothetical protein
MVFSVVMMWTLMMFISLAVDFGHVEVTKAQLQHAADAAARYGASGLANIINGQSAASANAVAAAADNYADGSPVVLNPSTDVQLVIWNPTTATYTVTTDPTLANGVRVTPIRSKARGNPVQMIFAKILGFSSCDINNVSAIATLSGGQSQTYTVPATSNPFLAGMPAGSKASLGNPHNNPDTAGTTAAPLQSPIKVGVPIAAGKGLTFDGINGGANNLPSSTLYNADGDPNTPVYNNFYNNNNGDDNNIGNMYAPINSLVGVFLDNSQPDQSPPPIPASLADVEYLTSDARSQQTYSPPLKQIFFIGDGRTDDGTVQTFIPPAGATRLYIATWDSYEWNNNVGSFTLTVHVPGSVSLVK